MSLTEKIELLKEVIEGLEELNGEFQEGWEPVINRANTMLKQMEDEFEYFRFNKK